MSFFRTTDMTDDRYRDMETRLKEDSLMMNVADEIEYKV